MLMTDKELDAECPTHGRLRRLGTVVPRRWVGYEIGCFACSHVVHLLHRLGGCRRGDLQGDQQWSKQSHQGRERERKLSSRAEVGHATDKSNGHHHQLAYVS